MSDILRKKGEIFLDKISKENFPLNRYLHCYNVGKKMQDYSLNVLKWSKEKSNEMFILGNLHDIGYEFDSENDGLVLSELLEKEGYKYYREIRYHAELQREYQSEEMDLLYFADLTVDGTGNWVSYDERLEDLINRYGKESKTVKDTIEIINYLKEKGFSDK